MNINTEFKSTKNNVGHRQLSDIKYIVIHYTANPGSSARANAQYYATASLGGVSAHYFVDEKGVWQCVPEDYIAGHCGKWANTEYLTDCRNANSIGIEMCCQSVSGKKAYQLTGNETDLYFTDGTYNNTVQLVKELIAKYNIPKTNVIRHYDVHSGHKNCPRPFVGNDVNTYYNQPGNVLWSKFVDKLYAKAPVVQVGYQSWVGKVVRLAANDTLNVRIAANPSSSLLSEWPHLSNDNLVDVIGEEYAPNGRMWYQVKIAGKYVGYVNASYVMPTAGDWVGVVKNATPYLNVRKNPEVRDNIYTAYPTLGNGNSIRVIGTVGKWYRIRIENGNDFHIAYVSSDYVMKV